MANALGLRMVVGLVALAGCPGTENETAQWETVFEQLDGALLSVWGTAADDVWTVGADPGDGPYALHWDGTAWSRIATGATGDLWWVWTDGAVAWMAGDAGLVIRHDVASGTSAIAEPVTDERLYGIFQLAPDDVWAVGGDPEQQTGVVVRYDGTAWSEVMLPDEITNGVTWFKVWGASASDVWIVGLGGRAIHYDGTAYTRVDVPIGRPLFTVHGNGSETLAVGGVESAHIVRAEGATLVNETPSGVVPQFNGVWVEPSGDAVAAGIGGAVWRRSDGDWAALDAPRLLADLHSTYVDPDGGIWAVGGFILTAPLHDGVMLHYGAVIGEGNL